jgi:transketolase
LTASHGTDELSAIANDLRKLIVTTLCRAQAGHPGGSLSAVEILTALYFRVLRIDPADPGWERRDRFVLSKGHAAAAYYAALALRGYFPVAQLETYDELDSLLQAHPDMHCPGVDMSTGSLGQGLSSALGMALGARLKGLAETSVFALLGDGELQEGQIWEAAMAAPKFGLGNLVAIVDDNRIQLMGDTSAIMPVDPIAEKWRAFNWHVSDVDGHDAAAVAEACEAARGDERPSVIVAHTVKGKGVSFMENTCAWHAAQIRPDEAEQALIELCADEAGA